MFIFHGQHLHSISWGAFWLQIKKVKKTWLRLAYKVNWRILCEKSMRRDNFRQGLSLSFHRSALLSNMSAPVKVALLWSQDNCQQPLGLHVSSLYLSREYPSTPRKGPGIHPSYTRLCHVPTPKLISTGIRKDTCWMAKPESLNSPAEKQRLWEGRTNLHSVSLNEGRIVLVINLHWRKITHAKYTCPRTSQNCVWEWVIYYLMDRDNCFFVYSRDIDYRPSALTKVRWKTKDSPSTSFLY